MFYFPNFILTSYVSPKVHNWLWNVENLPKFLGVGNTALLNEKRQRIQLEWDLFHSDLTLSPLLQYLPAPHIWTSLPWICWSTRPGKGLSTTFSESSAFILPSKVISHFLHKLGISRQFQVKNRNQVEDDMNLQGALLWAMWVALGS